MKSRNISSILVLSLILLMTMSSVLALTAKIGNARAVINANVGDTVERTIKIINGNNVSVVIELFASGNLTKDIKILDNNFTLAPNESKDARYEVYIRSSGTTENHINAKFTAVGTKQGVGISSTLTINVAGNVVRDTENNSKGLLGGLFGSGSNNNTENNNEENSIPTNSTGSGESSSGISTTVLLIIVLILILVALVSVFFYLKKRAEYSNSKEMVKTKPKKNVRKK